MSGGGGEGKEGREGGKEGGRREGERVGKRVEGGGREGWMEGYKVREKKYQYELMFQMRGNNILG